MNVTNRITNVSKQKFVPFFSTEPNCNFIVCFNQVCDQLFSDVGISNFRWFLIRVDAKFIFRLLPPKKGLSSKFSHREVRVMGDNKNVIMSSNSRSRCGASRASF